MDGPGLLAALARAAAAPLLRGGPRPVRAPLRALSLLRPRQHAEGTLGLLPHHGLGGGAPSAVPSAARAASRRAFPGAPRSPSCLAVGGLYRPPRLVLLPPVLPVSLVPAAAGHRRLPQRGVQ